jgi:Omp85 superfamily domain
VDPTTLDVPSLDVTAEPGMGTALPSGRSATPLVVPLPFRNSQLGWGGALMLGLIHRFDADTTIKPSTGAVGGLASENGSWGVMAIEVARINRDAWRVRGMANYLNLLYDFYGIGIDQGNAGVAIPLEQTLFMTAGVGLRRVTKGFYLGASVIWLETTVRLRDSVGGPAPIPDQGRAQLLAPGLQAEYDTRDSDYWPARGSLAELKARFFTMESGASGSFQRYTTAWSWYNGLRGRDLVLATNINFCAAPGDAPFYGLCSLGSGRYTMRGYTQGRYRDHLGNVVQAELRGHRARMGAVVFAGFGQVAGSAAEMFGAELLVAGGAGLRYQLTSKYPMHMRLDYAWGRDGGLLYFSVGEAF